MTAPDRIWAWRKTEQLSPDHVRMSFHWMGGHIPEPRHEGTDFLAGYIRADLATDPALFAEVVEALRGLTGTIWVDGPNAENIVNRDAFNKSLAVLAKLEARDG